MNLVFRVLYRGIRWAGRLSARLILRSEALRAVGAQMALGGGVSSRLFQRLHEREALVYSLGNVAEQESDSGWLGVYW